MTTPAKPFELLINGEKFAVDMAADKAVTPTTTLNDFLRHHTPFHATKVACNEGGCGSCTVALTYNDAAGKPVTRGINSCLAPLLSLRGMSVTTNDGIGSGESGYNAIQKKLAETSGTQCGYCSSGMVMSLYSYLQGNPAATQLELEKMLDGNLCRCTGYRPILEAFKSFGSDAPEKACMKARCCQRKDAVGAFDIEDTARVLAASNPPAAPLPPTPAAVYAAPRAKEATALNTNGTVQWVDVKTLSDLRSWMTTYKGLRVMLAVGATSQALYRKEYDVYLNVAAIPELQTLSNDAVGVNIGAAATIADAASYLKTVTPPPVAFAGTKHFPQAVDHLMRVASTLIRNRASLVGNLILTHQHQTAGDMFQSDVTVVMMGLGAFVTVLDAATGAQTTLSMTQFFAADLTMKIVLGVKVPWCATPTETFQSYKIAIRQTLDHAMVNCGMRAAVDPTTKKITGTPTVCIGGVLPIATRISSVEAAMVGMDITSAPAVVAVCGTLEKALAAGIDKTEGRVAYRVQVAVNYFYKFCLALQPSLPASLEKAKAVWMTRPLTSGTQTFGTDPAEHPVSEAIPKVDGLAQTAGEAVYTADIPLPYGALFGAVVQTTLANADILSVDPTVAKAIDGFVGFFDASSLPGERNDWVLFGSSNGSIFANGHSNFAGQNLGFVVAETEAVARRCAALIEATVKYGKQGAVLLSVDDGIAAGTAFSFQPEVSRGDINAKCDLSFEHTVSIGGQYHFHLENHAVLVQPVESQFVIDVAAQGNTMVQDQVASSLGLPASAVQVRTRRCGGAYGGKIASPSATATMAALAAKKLKRPVRFNSTFKDPFRAYGSRPLYQIQYKIGCNRDGTIVSLSLTNSVATGFFPSAAGEVQQVAHNIDNAYNIPNFSAKCVMYQTNVPPTASVRGPGWIQAIAGAELIVDAVAAKCGLAADQVRMKNFYKPGDTTPDGMRITSSVQAMWSKLQASGDLTARRLAVAKFNQENKFVKRGLALSACRFAVAWGAQYNACVVVYPDGSIAITHGGTEVGQGINTKVIQGAAFKFGLTAADMPSIKVQPTTTAICGNPGNITGGSITSELCTLAVMNACDIINARIAPHRREGYTWAEAVQAAVAAGLDLTATALSTGPQPGYPERYNSWGVAASEVEVDALTGQFEIKRSDLLFDCGVSMNPAVDVGQVEGAFMMGVGWFTSEEVKWDKTTGQAVMAGSWRYKPPGAHDVPEVLNVALLENSVNKVGVLSSKAVGEPPLSLAVSVVQAIEGAVNAARKDQGLPPWVCQSLPITVDKIAAMCAVTSSSYVLA